MSILWYNISIKHLKGENNMANNRFRETFCSPFGKDSKEGAERVLDAIRKSHPASSGWKEINSYTEQHSDGKWYAVRIHEKIS